MDHQPGFVLRLLVSIAILVAVLRPAVAQPTLEPQGTWTNVFADRDIQVRFTVKSANVLRGQVVWSLAAENDRTLSSGEVEVNADKDKPAEIVVKLHTPEVKPGVVLKTR